MRKISYTSILEYFIENHIILNSNQLSILKEGYIFSNKDIYYNKDKFDNNDINLCFIIGLSGSGKTTMGNNLSKKNQAEMYQLDDLLCVKDHFTYSQLKEYGDLIYSYFTGPGKRFYIGQSGLNDLAKKINGYEDIMIPEFVYYAMRYAKLHQDRKYILEGVWLYCKYKENNKYWFSPSEFDNYAVYIKGTSALLSFIRASKRDSSDGKDRFEKFKSFTKLISPKRFFKYYLPDEKDINRWRNYFKNK